MTYEKLMDLGRDVISAERIFGAGSVQHRRAVSKWTVAQKKLGIA